MQSSVFTFIYYITDRVASPHQLSPTITNCVVVSSTVYVQIAHIFDKQKLSEKINIVLGSSEISILYDSYLSSAILDYF